jgi:hypothetical protein
MPSTCFLVERLFALWVTETEAALARGEAPDPVMVAEILKEAQRARDAEARLRKACGNAVRHLRNESPQAAEAALEQALEIRLRFDPQ